MAVMARAMYRKKRRAAIVAVLVLVAAFAAAVPYGVRVASIGVAYKAKMLCSGIFVSRRDSEQVLTDLHIDDLTMLRYVNASIDANARSVTATALGVVRRRAVYRNGVGCAVVPDGWTPRGWPTADEHLTSRGDNRVRPLVANAGGAATFTHGTTDRLKGAVDRAFAEPEPLRLRRTQAVVIVHNGRVVAERYAEGFGPDTPLCGWSMAKSVMNALVAVLVMQGRLSVDLPAPVPEWHAAGDPRAQITVDHLLRMSSGLRFDEDMTNPLADVTSMLLGVADKSTYARDKELEATPGTKWHYSSATSNIIARIIRNVLKDDREYLTFPRRALFDRIGMGSAVLETDAADTFVGSSFMYATARDWARFGTLYLQDGVWDGQRVLPEGWVSYSRSPAPADPRRHYGAHFWLDVPDEYRGTEGTLPADAFHAAGHEAQFVTVIPSRHAVIVRLGRTRYPDAWDHPSFVRDVLTALQEARE